MLENNATSTKRMGGSRTQGEIKYSLPGKPLITIITIVFNGAEFLEDTIKSVLSQTYNNIEYIIIDGGSTDKSIDIIQKYEEEIDLWISEPDKGISDAFNKGYSHAHGDLVGLIHSDDWFEKDAIPEMLKTIDVQKNVVFYGNMRIHYLKSNQSKILKPGKLSHFKWEFPLLHPSVFVSKKVIRENSFDLQYKIAMDYDFLSGLYRDFPGQFQYVDLTIANMRDSGISNTSAIKGFKEVYHSSIKNKLTGKIQGLFYLFFRIFLYYLILLKKKIIGN